MHRLPGMGSHCIRTSSCKCCLSPSETTFHKKITCAILIHNPQTNLHRKTIYDFVWIYLHNHCTRKLPVWCWPITNRQLLWGKKLYNVVSASPLKSMGGTPTRVTRVAWVLCLFGCVGQTFLVWVKYFLACINFFLA